MTEWLKSGATAVITGGAGGIGLAAATRFAAAGMNLVLVDLKEAELETAAAILTDLGAEVMTEICDVSDLSAFQALQTKVTERFGPVHCLMNNAGIGRMGTKPWEDIDAFHETIAINLFGVVNGCHAFIPSMLEHGQQGAVINTASKQGITRPPGNYAYNLSKSGVLAHTESVAHAFRGEENCQLSAHLLVPGFVYTPMVKAFIPQKPAFAATAEETVDYMMERLADEDFYIICPDNETPRALDEKRIQWTADDLIKNRPALSRWHGDYEAEFKAFIEDE
ncbi:MAG: SDR family NAD(P)-dependent oxidoreductase [Pseudomonadota bacterium]